MTKLLSSQFDLSPPTGKQFERLVSGLNSEERHLLLDHSEEAPFCGVFLTAFTPVAYAPAVVQGGFEI